MNSTPRDSFCADSPCTPLHTHQAHFVTAADISSVPTASGSSAVVMPPHQRGGAGACVRPGRKRARSEPRDDSPDGRGPARAARVERAPCPVDRPEVPQFASSTERQHCSVCSHVLSDLRRAERHLRQQHGFSKRAAQMTAPHVSFLREGPKTQRCPVDGCYAHVPSGLSFIRHIYSNHCKCVFPDMLQRILAVLEPSDDDVTLPRQRGGAGACVRPGRERACREPRDDSPDARCPARAVRVERAPCPVDRPEVPQFASSTERQHCSVCSHVLSGLRRAERHLRQHH